MRFGRVTHWPINHAILYEAFYPVNVRRNFILEMVTFTTGDDQFGSFDARIEICRKVLIEIGLKLLKIWYENGLKKIFQIFNKLTAQNPI